VVKGNVDRASPLMGSVAQYGTGADAFDPSCPAPASALSQVTPTYTLGGTISGLTAPGLVLANGNDTLTLPANVARAAAPFGAALLWTLAGGYGAVLWAVVAGGVIAALGFWYAAAHGEAKAAP
jgi:hypothetical protein